MKFFCMYLALLCKHQCEVGLYKIDFVAFKEKK